MRTLLCAAVLSTALSVSLPAQETEATRQLRERNAEFRREIIRVTDGVYAANGYGASIFTMVVGVDGFFLVDTGQDPEWSGEALAEFRKITQAPLKAIIFTHGHGDHINGAPAFAKPGNDVEVWAHERFGSEGTGFADAGITIDRQRGARQAGFQLPPEKRINNGIAPAVYPRGNAFSPQSAALAPGRKISERTEAVIAGVKVVLAPNPGETDDQLYVWLPEKKVAFAGDNFYKSWPNLYAIRGTPYRDVRDWAAAVRAVASLKPDHLVGGHTRPISGQQQVAEVLGHYAEAITYVFQRTIAGMNMGRTPDQIVEMAKLPLHLAEKDYLKPYYGHPDWAVRSIFSGYLGWFDGNPTNLFPLTPRAEAERMAKLAGGPAKLLAQAQKAMEENDAQWAAQLCDYLLALTPSDEPVRLLKARALEHLAEHQLNATARNYYLSIAQQLRKPPKAE